MTAKLNSQQPEPLAKPGSKDTGQPRKLSRETRRGQLIEATIATLATRGFARTTLTEVANLAGLSHGLVNFHFQSKEKLLAETLNHLAEEYRHNWTRAIASVKPEPALQLDALIRADFNPEICTAERLSAWCAFWGEAQSRPLYQERCGANDKENHLEIERVCTALVKEGNYTRNPIRAARALRVLSDGFWFDLMTASTDEDRDEALATMFASAAAFFPDHFNESGLITS